jgi:hypothetical protein
MTETELSGQGAKRAHWGVLALILAPMVVLVVAGVAYRDPARLNVNLACFSGALLYVGTLFLFKSDWITEQLQPGKVDSGSATRVLGGIFVALAAWQLFNAFMY